MRQSERHAPPPRGGRAAARARARLPLHLHARGARGAPPGHDRRRRQVDLRRPLPRRRPRPRRGPAHRAPARAAARGASSGTTSCSGRAARTPREIGDMILQRSDGTHALPPRRRRRRRRHAHHTRDPRRRPPPQHPLQLALYAALGAPPPRFAHVPADRRRRRQEALEAPRPGGDPALPRGGLPARRRCATGWCASAGPTATRRSSRARRSRALRPRRGRALARRQVDQAKLALAEPALAEVAAARAPARARGALPRRRRRAARSRRRRSSSCWSTCCASAAAPCARWPSARASLSCDAVAFDEAAAREAPDAGGRRPARGAARAARRPRRLERGRRSSAAFEAVRAAHGDLPLGKLAQPVRVAVTGRAASPPIYETLRVLGKERSLRRLGAALTRVAAVEHRGRAGRVWRVSSLPRSSNGRTAGSEPANGGSNPPRGSSSYGTAAATSESYPLWAAPSASSRSASAARPVVRSRWARLRRALGCAG